jgi:hypothetical protein
VNKGEQLIEYLLLAGIGVMTVAFAYAILDATSKNVKCCIVKDNASVHLPSKCKEYYNSGTDEWSKCMLVEAK